MITRHTFLVQEGTWKALGYYSDVFGNIHPLEGLFVISRLKNKLVAQARIGLHGPMESEFFQVFVVPSFSEGENLQWKSKNLVAGSMEGKAMFINEYIFLLYGSSDGRYSGVENLERLDDLHYKNHGFAFSKEQKMASWVMDLRRIK